MAWQLRDSNTFNVQDCCEPVSACLAAPRLRRCCFLRCCGGGSRTWRRPCDATYPRVQWPQGIVWLSFGVTRGLAIHREWPRCSLPSAIHLYAQFKWHTQRRRRRSTARPESFGRSVVRPPRSKPTGRDRRAGGRMKGEI